jgi:hypothetical protein
VGCGRGYETGLYVQDDTRVMHTFTYSIFYSCLELTREHVEKGSSIASPHAKVEGAILQRRRKKRPRSDRGRNRESGTSQQLPLNVVRCTRADCAGRKHFVRCTLHARIDEMFANHFARPRDDMLRPTALL